LTLIQKESESLRDPNSSEGYARWRNLTPTTAPRVPFRSQIFTSYKRQLGLQVGIIGYISYALAFMVRQLGGIQHVPRTVGLAEFFGLFKD